MPQRVEPAALADADDDDEFADDDFRDMHAARKIRNENRNLRSRAKDAEGERDNLRGQVDALRRGEIERLLATELADPRDLLDRTPDITSLLDDNGYVDPARVSTAVAADRPHLAAAPVVTAPPTDRPIESLRPGASPDRRPTEPTSWRSAIAPLLR